MQSTKAQRGFTLIELVVVITILGILAAFAVPRFAGLERDARFASLQALAGSIRSSAALSHALWLAQGQPATVTMEGAPSPITIVNGYPDRASIANTLSDTTGFTYDPATGIFSRAGAPANCRLTYTQAPANGAPRITVNAANRNAC